ncbi:hypothetical protein CEXT_690571 [Caerostris extrusa]|uniref:Uncharacterized protein n=1 Tax=Caerostris extrusa TaxID=172846 RepID=A0AAV4MML0_CAEEX|nr:hypothetical protein CEXT_690571 [Caerostris extrusa]
MHAGFLNNVLHPFPLVFQRRVCSLIGVVAASIRFCSKFCVSAAIKIDPSEQLQWDDDPTFCGFYISRRSRPRFPVMILDELANENPFLPRKSPQAASKSNKTILRQEKYIKARSKDSEGRGEEKEEEEEERIRALAEFAVLWVLGRESNQFWNSPGLLNGLNWPV